MVISEGSSFGGVAGCGDRIASSCGLPRLAGLQTPGQLLNVPVLATLGWSRLAGLDAGLDAGFAGCVDWRQMELRFGHGSVTAFTMEV